MDALFGSVGMTSMTIVIFTIEVLSLCMMIAVILAYRRAARKQTKFLRTLIGGPTHERHHRLIIVLYIAGTLCIGAISAYLFIFQPHAV